jgi:hypothetical protein
MGASPGTMRAWHTMPPHDQARTESMDGSKAACSDGILYVRFFIYQLPPRAEPKRQFKSQKHKHVLLSNGADRSRSKELHVCIAPGHNKSQRQYGSAVYLTLSQTGVGECCRGDESSG